MLSASVISEIAGFPIACGQGSKAPGTLKKHYAPNTPAQMVSSEELLALIERSDRPLVILARHKMAIPADKQVRCLNLPDNPQGYAQAVYSMLRYADSLRAYSILIEQPPEGEEGWTAVKDRLQRACAH